MKFLRPIVQSAVFSFILLTAMTASAASLTQLQSQLNQAQSNLTHYQQLQANEQTKSQQYQQDISGLQNQITNVQNTISSLQSQISTKQNDIDQTTNDIQTQTNQLNDLTNKMNASLADFYEVVNLSDTSFVTADKSLSQINDRTEYLQALQEQMMQNISKVTQARKDLEDAKSHLQQQQQELAALKGDAEQKNANLNAQQNQIAGLLSQSKANQAEYQTYINKLSAQKDQLDQQIYQLRQQLAAQGREVTTNGASGYPYVGAGYWYADPWGFYKGECTSYAAWKWNSLGHPFYDVDPGYGNAKDWPTLARAQGYSTSSSPRPGDIISWAANYARGMPYGHVAYVEAVNSDGTIDVSEANWATPHGTDYRSHVSYQDYGRATFIHP